MPIPGPPVSVIPMRSCVRTPISASIRARSSSDQGSDPEDGDPEPRRPEVEPFLPRHLDHAKRIGRDPRERGRPEIPQELELEQRPPGPDRDHHGPERLGPEVEAEAAREQAEGRRHQQDVRARSAPAAASERAMISRHWATSAAVYGLTIGAPVVPDDMWTRRIGSSP